jgi:circadian clock protein KaiA
LAVYYKRNPRQFFRHLDRQQKQELLDQLRSQYRQIVLAYFTENGQINDTIDEFVSSAFFSDLSVSEIVKIHMELMEEFAKQLKLEGRSEEILLDYRLTLIDIIAHLCEMYRRSVPREM